jgi:protocatechuate 4,5-dioxygenase alpha subunit
MEMVHLAPERIEKLALIDTGVDARREGEEEKRQVMIDLAYAEGMRALADTWLPPMLHEGRVNDETLLVPLKAMVMRATPEQHHRQIQALLNRPNVRPHLPNIICPTLVMVGRQDRWSPLAQHEEMASLIPNSELVVIEDSGHMSLLEQPEQVTRALLRFLGFKNDYTSADRGVTGEINAMSDDGTSDRIPDTPLFDRKRSLRGYHINKMAMGLSNPANREAFRENESAYLERFGLTSEEKEAVMTRNWREMVRLGGNLFFILKISAVDPVRITEIGAHQAGMEHADFLRDRLGKK